jgi:hypothetical protein
MKNITKPKKTINNNYKKKKPRALGIQDSLSNQENKRKTKTR